MQLSRAQTQQTLEINQEELRLTRDAKISEQFTRATDQLGSEKLEIRLGGIYALERIARDSELDHWPIMEILTTYVRENAPWKEQWKDSYYSEKIFDESRPIGVVDRQKPPAPDIQAILTVIGRRKRTFGNGETVPLNLQRTDLRGAIFIGAQLAAASFEGANFGGACFDGANLFGASLEAAILKEAFFREANLEGMKCDGANFTRANLKAAKLRGTNISGVDFRGATFKGADLTGADLLGTHLQHAILGANSFSYIPEPQDQKYRHRDALGLTEEGISWAQIDEKTWLPKYLRPLKENAVDTPPTTQADS